MTVIEWKTLAVYPLWAEASKTWEITLPVNRAPNGNISGENCGPWDGCRDSNWSLLTDRVFSDDDAERVQREKRGSFLSVVSNRLVMTE